MEATELLELQPVTLHGVVILHPEGPLGEFVRKQYSIISEKERSYSVALIHSAIMLELNRTKSRYKGNPEIFLLDARMSKVLEINAIRGADIHLQIRRLSTARGSFLEPGPFCEGVNDDLKPAFMKNQPYGENELVRIKDNIMRFLRESMEFCTMPQTVTFGEFCNVLKRYVAGYTTRNAVNIIDLRGSELAEAWPVDMFHDEQILALAGEMCTVLSMKVESVSTYCSDACQCVQCQPGLPDPRSGREDEEMDSSTLTESCDTDETMTETNSETSSDENSQFAISSMKPKGTLVVSELRDSYDYLLMPPPRSKGTLMKGAVERARNDKKYYTQDGTCSGSWNNGEKCLNQVVCSFQGALFCEECWNDKTEQQLKSETAMPESPLS